MHRSTHVYPANIIHPCTHTKGWYKPQRPLTAAESPRVSVNQANSFPFGLPHRKGPGVATVESVRELEAAGLVSLLLLLGSLLLGQDALEHAWLGVLAELDPKGLLFAGPCTWVKFSEPKGQLTNICYFN